MASFLEQINNRSQNQTTTQVSRPVVVEEIPAESPVVIEEIPAEKSPAKEFSAKNDSDIIDEIPAKNTAVSNEALSQSAAVPRGIASTEHEAVVDHSYFKRKMITGIISAAAALVGIFLCCLLIYWMRLVEVKDFTGRSIAEMRKWATESKLVLDEKNIYDDTATEGIILSQDIHGGKKLSPKSVISVTVSLGADPTQSIEVPDLMNMSASSIREWINTQKLTATKISEINDDSVAKGTVIRYEYGSVSVSDDNFKRNDSLTIYVSKGPATPKPTSTVTVPDYSEVAKEDVEKYSSDLSAAVKNIYSNTVPYGGYIRQSIAAGEKAEKNGKITVYYSMGAPFLPDLTGKNQADLAELFYTFNSNGAELTYKIEYASGNMAKGQVISASKNNEFVSVGDTITIKVCNENTVTVPDFSTVLKEDAAGYCADLTVTVKNIYSNSVPYGGYVRQSIAAGKKADRSANLTVYYSIGRPFLPYLTGKNESELGELFYTFNYNGANLNYQIEYISGNVARGQVISSSKNNELVNVGDKITIYVCKENVGLTVPDFSKISKEDAANYSGGLSVTVKSIYHNTLPYGKYISQSVSAGAQANESDKIIVYYSLGLPFLPDLTGRNESELAELFYSFNSNGAELTYKIDYVSSYSAKGCVVSASRNNEFVLVGDKITIAVCQATFDVTVPDYSAVAKDDAADYCDDFVVTVKSIYSNTVAEDEYISQSVAAGKHADQNDRITVYYSLGLPFLPDLTAKTESDLSALFTTLNKDGAKLTYQINYVTDSSAAGTILSASKNNEYVSVGDDITINVSQGSTP